MARTTEAERQEIRIVVREMLERRERNGKIKAYVAEEFDISPRSVEQYICYARRELRSRTGKSDDELRNDSSAFYMRKRENSAADRDQIFANSENDKLLGIRIPSQKVAPKVGIDLTLDQIMSLSDDDLKLLNERLDALCKSD